MNSGVYQIKNQESGQVYIGSTKDLTHRWSTHRSRLKTGRHYCLSLQADWYRLGSGSFTFEVLEEVADKPTLVSRETAWIATRRDEGVQLYNAYNARFGQGPQAEKLRGTEVQHGTYSSYANYHCRCDECTAATREYQRARYLKRKQDGPYWLQRPNVQDRIRPAQEAA